MAKITIEIKGVAICYYTAPTSEWRVLLPFNNDHQINFTANHSSTPIPLKGPFKEIEINVKAPKSTATAPARDFFDDFITVKGDHSHKEIEPLQTWNDYGVLMTVPFASFQKVGETKCQYRMVRASGPGPAPNPKGYAKVVYAGKILVEGDEITLKATGTDLEFTQHFKTDSIITIDNTCPKSPSSDEGADFKLVYNLIKDKGYPGREFTMERLPSERPVPISSIVQLIYTLLGRRPIWNITDNPNPQEAGMPCNIIGGGSDPGGLPTN